MGMLLTSHFQDASEPSGRKFPRLGWGVIAFIAAGFTLMCVVIAKPGREDNFVFHLLKRFSQ